MRKERGMEPASSSATVTVGVEEEVSVNKKKGRKTSSSKSHSHSPSKNSSKSHSQSPSKSSRKSKTRPEPLSINGFSARDPTPIAANREAKPATSKEDENDEVGSIASAETDEVDHTSPREDNAENEDEAAAGTQNAAKTYRPSFRRLRAHRKRVPGGAAAKLIGKPQDQDDAIQGSYSTNTDADDEDVRVPTDEFERIRQAAQAEFAVGPRQNRRYHIMEEHKRSDYPENLSEASIPSILNRSELFHENATAAVLSLLSPGMDSTESMQDEEQCSPRSKKTSKKPKTSLLPPPKGGNTNPSSNSEANMEYEESALGKGPLEQPLLSERAKVYLEEMEKKMKDPDKKLGDLIAAISSPRDGILSRGYMVRRKNACGALQVLTAKNIHRVQLCWTAGVLSSLSSVLEDSGNRDLEEIFPDPHTRKEFVEARKRAVSSLMNLSIPPQNRLAVFHSRRLVSNVIRVINMDSGEARRGCCAVLAHLAKAKENRLLMSQVPGLIKAISDVIEPKEPGTQGQKKHLEKTYESTEEVDNRNKDDVSTSKFEMDCKKDGDDSVGSVGASVGAASLEGNLMATSERQSNSLSLEFNQSIEDPAAAARRYDEDPNVFLTGARQNVFALLSHLVKEKDNAYILARNKHLIEILVAISYLHMSPSHELAVRLLAHFTRHRGNSKLLVFNLRKVVPALVKATLSLNDESRKHACFAIQNLAQDKPCRQELAASPGLLTALCVRVRQASETEERLAAMHALKNLTDEPANLIPMTNTPECFATLMQIAHASDDSVTQMMQYLGCDSLAALSHWFRSIATSGQRIESMKRGEKPKNELFVPTLKIISYKQWE